MIFILLFLFFIDSVQAACPTGTTALDGGCKGKLATVLESSSACAQNGNLEIWVNSALGVNEITSILQTDIECATIQATGRITGNSVNIVDKITTDKLQTRELVVGNTLVIDGSSNGAAATFAGRAAIATTCTGNAATATKLSNPVSIGGVSFDGSAAISLPGVNAPGTMATSGNADSATYAESAGSAATATFATTAGRASSSGSASSAVRLTPRILHAGGAPTSFGIAPKDLPSYSVQVAITNWAYNTWNEGYADSILLNTWYDSSGGNVNILKVRKNGIAMKVEQGGFNSGSRMATWNNVQMTAGSDERLKKNIQTIEDPLTKITKLRGVNFEWRKKFVTSKINETSEITYNDKYDEGLQMGFIAQEVNKVIPEVVENDHIGFEGLDGVLALDYAKITALLVEGIKELNKKVEKLSKKVEELTKN